MSIVKRFNDQLNGSTGAVTNFVTGKINTNGQSFLDIISSIQASAQQAIDSIGQELKNQLENNTGDVWYTVGGAAAPPTGVMTRLMRLAPPINDFNRFIYAFINLPIPATVAGGFAAIGTEDVASTTGPTNTLFLDGNLTPGANRCCMFIPRAWGLSAGVYRPTAGTVLLPLGHRNLGPDGIGLWIQHNAAVTTITNYGFVYRANQAYTPY